MLETNFLKKEEIDYIEKLSDELSWVFDFNNEDSDNMAQKEELLKKVLQLGGDNYTFIDLRRDLSSIEEEDKFTKNTLTNKSSYEDEEKITGVHQCLTE